MKPLNALLSGDRVCFGELEAGMDAEQCTVGRLINDKSVAGKLRRQQPHFYVVSGLRQQFTRRRLGKLLPQAQQ